MLYARLPRLRWAIRHPLKALDRQGVPPWLAFVTLFGTASVTAWLLSAYVSIRR